MDIGVILKRFEAPDEVREMILGRFEVVGWWCRGWPRRPSPAAA
jgi:hypothetical protein